jgi:hypothetical protein
VSKDNRRWVLREIALDVERDVIRFEGQPFTGRVVAEYMGCQAAAIKALAEIVETLLPADPAAQPGLAEIVATLLPSDPAAVAAAVLSPDSLPDSPDGAS